MPSQLGAPAGQRMFSPQQSWNPKSITSMLRRTDFSEICLGGLIRRSCTQSAGLPVELRCHPQARHLLSGRRLCHGNGIQISASVGPPDQTPAQSEAPCSFDTCRGGFHVRRGTIMHTSTMRSSGSIWHRGPTSKVRSSCWLGVFCTA